MGDQVNPHHAVPPYSELEMAPLNNGDKMAAMCYNDQLIPGYNGAQTTLRGQGDSVGSGYNGAQTIITPKGQGDSVGSGYNGAQTTPCRGQGDSVGSACKREPVCYLSELIIE